MLRRKKVTVASADSSSWTVAPATYRDRPMVIRINRAYESATNLSDYPVRIGVALPLNDPDERGWPRANGEEAPQLQAAEKLILSAVRDRAVLVLVITGTDMREFVLHAQTGDWVPEFHRQADAIVATHAVEVIAETDVDWSVFRQFAALLPART